MDLHCSTHIDQLNKRGNRVTNCPSLSSDVEPRPDITTLGELIILECNESNWLNTDVNSSMVVLDGRMIMAVATERYTTSTSVTYGSKDSSDIRKRAFSFPSLGKKAKYIGIPTTSGTGQVTPFAVISDKTNNRKYHSLTTHWHQLLRSLTLLVLSSSWI